MLRLVVMLLAALGGAVAGAYGGMLLFAAVFELLRGIDLDQLLDARGSVHTAIAIGAVAGAAFAAWSARRGADAAAPPWRRELRLVGTATLAGFGGTLTAAVLAFLLAASVAELFGRGGFRMLEYGMIAAFVAAVPAALSSVWLALRPTAGTTPATRMLVARGGAAVAILLLIGLAAVPLIESFNTALPGIGRPARLMFQVQLPDGMPMPASPDQVRIELRTGTRTLPATVRGPWQKPGWGPRTLAGEVSLAERTRRRELVVVLPGQPEHRLALALPANPRRTGTFSADVVMTVAPDAARSAAGPPIVVTYRIQ